MKVLVADDSHVARIQLRRLLEGMDYEVVEARDGLEALDALTGPGAPLIAVLDWLMPGLDGPDVCARVRAMDPKVPPYLMLLTTKDTKEDLIAGLGKGANDFVSKPFHEGELRARIRVGENMVRLEQALASRVEALEEAMAHIKTLQGIIPICMYCHKIRDDGQLWQRLEHYLSEHTDLVLSHGVCPECKDRMRQELREK